jgi:hypothetical protein
VETGLALILAIFDGRLEMKTKPTKSSTAQPTAASDRGVQN